MLPAKTSVNTESKDGGGRRLDSVEALWTPVSWLTLALVTVTAAALRFLFLARKPFWFDECFSVEVARLSWHDMVRLLWRREANMSLYYLLLRGWLHFGSSPFFIRGLSVIFSLATLPAIFWLAGRLFDRRVALVAVALMSSNAYAIRYAQEARSYSLFVLLATLSSGFLVATFARAFAPQPDGTCSGQRAGGLRSSIRRAAVGGAMAIRAGETAPHTNHDARPRARLDLDRSCIIAIAGLCRQDRRRADPMDSTAGLS